MEVEPTSSKTAQSEESFTTPSKKRNRKTAQVMNQQLTRVKTTNRFKPIVSDRKTDISDEETVKHKTDKNQTGPESDTESESANTKTKKAERPLRSSYIKNGTAEKSSN